MIDEHTFAERYTSFWQRTLPMGVDVTAAVNNHLTKVYHQDSENPPEQAYSIPSKDAKLYRDLVAEISLRWFSARVKNGVVSPRRPSSGTRKRLTREAAAFIARLHRSARESGLANAPTVEELSQRADQFAEVQEALAEMLEIFVKREEAGKNILPAPPFDGCGLLSACQGDLLIGETLYEVKAVGQGFHQTHLRQLVVYCALNFAAPRHEIRRVGLVNPYRGTFFRSDLELLVRNLSGQNSSEVFNDIVDFLSTERVSA